jgi:glutathione S-transferase
MLKIWGRKDSSNVQKVLWCCAELGVAFERVDLGGRFGGNKEKPYLDLNPNGVVPTIEDGSFVLWESNSIVRYLVDKYGHGRLHPDSPEGRANANRWMDWQLTTLGPAIIPLFVGLVRTPKENRDRAAIDEALKKTVAAWKIVERYLEKTPYIAAADLSIGDIPLGVWAYRWFNLPVDRPDLARLTAWYERLTQRPAYKTHIMTPLS